MLTKHFLKTLIIFMVMIIAGLIGVFLVGYFSQTNSVDSSTDTMSNAQ